MQLVLGRTGLLPLRVPPGYALGSRTIITATGTSTYTPPAGARLLLVECVGGGGGGAAAPNPSGGNLAAGAGGASGGYAAAIVSPAMSATFTVTVNAGGASALAGGPTTFAATESGLILCNATGSNTPGGITSGSTEAFALGGGGVAGTAVGDVVLTPNSGGSSHRVSGSIGISGFGAPSRYGAGGAPVITTSNGNPGGNYGAGGSGAVSISAGGTKTGGHGGQGVIIVWEFY